VLYAKGQHLTKQLTNNNQIMLSTVDNVICLNELGTSHYQLPLALVLSVRTSTNVNIHQELSISCCISTQQMLHVHSPGGSTSLREMTSRPPSWKCGEVN